MIGDFFSEAVFLGVFITLGAYFFGIYIKQKFTNPLKCNLVTILK